MALTDKTTVLAQYIQALINTNKIALGVSDVLYGEHNNIGKAKTVVVNSGTKTRQVQGAAMPGGNSLVRMTVLITVYNSTVGDEGTQRLAVDQLAEAVETLLHQNTTMGGLIIHGFCETVDPGIKFNTGSMFRVTQITFVGQAKVRITP
jgi:hypothetical protein